MWYKPILTKLEKYLYCRLQIKRISVVLLNNSYLKVWLQVKQWQIRKEAQYHKALQPGREREREKTCLQSLAQNKEAVAWQLCSRQYVCMFIVQLHYRHFFCLVLFWLVNANVVINKKTFVQGKPMHFSMLIRALKREKLMGQRNQGILSIEKINRDCSWLIVS